MSPHGYAESEHQADLALKVWGEDFAALLHQAVEGMLALMGVSADAEASCQEIFSLPCGNPEENLVDFLGEVLYLLEEKKIVLAEFTISERDPLVISGSFHPLVSMERWIKAVTFHNLVIENTPDGLETTITFDV